MAREGRGKRRTRLGRARSEGEVSTAREDLISEVASMREGESATGVQGKDFGGILQREFEVSEDQNSRKICAEETSRTLKNLMKSKVVPSLARAARSQTETSRRSP